MPRKASKPQPIKPSRPRGHKLQTLKGFKDNLPDSQKYWNFVLDRVKTFAEDYTYGKIDTPILEPVSLFERTVGKSSDVVSKEMFDFEDKGGEKVVLRPEMTAPVARAYIQHGMLTWPQPVKLWYEGPMFRYDKPQSGRLRQFHQFGFEIFGSPSAETDANLITMVAQLYKSFGLDVQIEINSIGCPECRKEYVKELKKYFKGEKICKDCEDRLEINPLRVLDCKEKKCQEIIKEAPQIVDYLCEDCKKHFFKVLEGFDDSELTYNLNPFLVRGLDYYNRTTFEVYLKDEEIGSQNALGGGGRYDYLVEELGGRSTPAVGFAGGIERVILKLKEKNIEIKDELGHTDVFVAQLGDDAKKKARKLFNELRKTGIKAKQAFNKKGLSDQMEEANRLNARFTLILGQKEIIDGTIIIRDMESGVQEIINFDKTVDEMKKRVLETGGVKVYNS